MYNILGIKRTRVSHFNRNVIMFQTKANVRLSKI